MSASCPACGAALEDRRELGSVVDGGRSLERVRYECGGCRAIVGRDFRLPPGGARVGREAAGAPGLVFTGASAARALEPMERRARGGDRAGVLDELRSLQRGEETQFLGVTEAAQRAVRGIRLRLTRHASLPIAFRPAAAPGGALVAALFPEGRPRLLAARLVEELPLTDEELDRGGVVLPAPGAVELPGSPEVLLLLAGTILTAAGAEVGVLRVRPPDPKPALRDWGPVDALLVDLNLVAAE